MDTDPCVMSATTAAGIPHDLPFDPSYGWTEERLRAVQFKGPEPEGYEAFWVATYARTQEETQGPLEVRVAPFSIPGFTVHEVYFTTLGGLVVGGWLCLPESGACERVEIRTHGYGGIEGPPPDLEPESATFQLCLPGFGLSLGNPPVFPSESLRHVLAGIESPDTYSHRYCVAAVWSAVRILATWPGLESLPVHYRGWSFGGGIGAMALPWEPRFCSAEIGQPSFGWHPFRLRQICMGSGEMVRRYWQGHPDARREIEYTLAFHDAVFAARRICIPVLFVLSMFDPMVPPPGQFAVAQACPSEAKWVLGQRCGHFDWIYPEMEAEAVALSRARGELSLFARAAMGAESAGVATASVGLVGP